MSVSSVSIVVVSHSPLVAQGAADIVHGMVGEQIAVAHCGGNGEGDLGTNVEQISEAIRSVYTPRGVVVLVDLGAAETNSELAIEQLPEPMRDHVVLADAPIVEGAIMAAIEAASGASLDEVRASAEAYRS